MAAGPARPQLPSQPPHNPAPAAASPAATKSGRLRRLPPRRAGRGQRRGGLPAARGGAEGSERRGEKERGRRRGGPLPAGPAHRAVACRDALSGRGVLLAGRTSPAAEAITSLSRVLDCSRVWNDRRWCREKTLHIQPSKQMSPLLHRLACCNCFPNLAEKSVCHAELCLKGELKSTLKNNKYFLSLFTLSEQHFKSKYSFHE